MNNNKTNNDHHANQMNPNSSVHQAAMNNHSNQLNPNHSSYQAKGSGSSSGKKK